MHRDPEQFKRYAIPSYYIVHDIGVSWVDLETRYPS
jgi:hypothetical protein